MQVIFVEVIPQSEVFVLFCFVSFCLVLAAPTACGNFRARDQTRDTAATQATAVTTPDP